MERLAITLTHHSYSRHHLSATVRPGPTSRPCSTAWSAATVRHLKKIKSIILWEYKCDPASQNHQKTAIYGFLVNPIDMWPCITKPTKSRMAQFCVMARNRWSGSAWVIFRFWYILKEQSFFYIILKFGSIKRIISRVICCFSRPIFLWSDGRCDHSTCPIISLWTWLSSVLWTLISFERSKQRCQPLDTKNQTDNPKKSDFPPKNRIFTKSSETIAKYHNFFHLRMLAQRHDSNSYS